MNSGRDQNSHDSIEFEEKEMKYERLDSDGMGSSLRSRDIYTLDGDELYEELRKSISLNDGKVIPDFSTKYTITKENFEKSEITSPFPYKNYIKILSNGWAAVWTCKRFNSDRILAPHYSSSLKIIDVITHKKIFSFCDTYWINTKYHSQFSNFAIKDVIFLPAEKLLVIAGGGHPSGSYGLRLYSVNGENFSYLGRNFYDCGYEVKVVSALMDGFFIAGSNSYTRVYDSKSEVFSIKQPANCFAVIPDGRVAIGAEDNKNISVYQCDKAGKLELLNSWPAHQSHVNSLAFLVNGYLASGGGGSFYCTDPTIHVWNINDGSLVYSLPSNRGFIKKLIALPNGWLCAMAGDSDWYYDHNTAIWNTDLQREEVSYFSDDIALSEDSHLAMSYRNSIKFLNVSEKNNHNEIIPSEVSFFPETLKFKIFYFYNLIKNCHGVVSLSGKNISDDDIDVLIRLMHFCTPRITELDLSFNIFNSCKIVELVKEILSPKFKDICKLNFSGNKLKNIEANEIMGRVKYSKSLKEVDLSSNLIDFDNESLRSNKKKINKPDSDFSVDLSQNYLNDDCDQHFEESKGDVSKYRYLFFKTAPKETKSIIDPIIKISKNNWIITLSSSKKINHAMIYLEGMKENGQMILERYHITQAKGRLSVATQMFEKIDSDNFNPDKYFFQKYPISDIQGETFRDMYKRKHGEQVCFSMFSTSSADDCYNCLTWAIKALSKINVKVDPCLIPTPICYARGRSLDCVVS